MKYEENNLKIYLNTLQKYLNAVIQYMLKNEFNYIVKIQ